MSFLIVKRCTKPFDIAIDEIAPDKSISHRAAMFSLLSDKPSRVRNFLRAEDTFNTLKIVQKLGAKVEDTEDEIIITPSKKITEPDDVLDCGNSGTGMRLFCGLLAGVEGFFILTGDKYLRSRPMARVAKPLRSIGAKVDGREEGNKAPLAIRGNSKLESFFYTSPISSAQVKSAMILAALRAKGKSEYTEPLKSRDHTERMLRGMGAQIQTQEAGVYRVFIEPMEKPLRALDITIPADPSSAFFLAVAAAIVPKSRVELKNLTLNPTRIEAFKVLQRMGAKVTLMEKENRYEPIGDIVIEHNDLQGAIVDSNISWLIDELPALAIAMAVAKGKSVVKNAKELRVKESDRIASVVKNLQKCGIEVQEYEDGYEIVGGKLKSAVIQSFGDHRIAMSFAIAGLLADMKIEDVYCIATSFPNFIQILQKITEVERGD